MSDPARPSRTAPLVMLAPNLFFSLLLLVGIADDLSRRHLDWTESLGRFGFQLVLTATLAGWVRDLGGELPHFGYTLASALLWSADWALWTGLLGVADGGPISFCLTPYKLWGLFWMLRLALRQRRAFPRASPGWPLAMAAVLAGTLCSAQGFRDVERRRRLSLAYRLRSECKANLKALYTAERSYYAEHDRYSDSLQTVGFEPERPNHYAYFASFGGSVEQRSRPGAHLAPTDTGIAVDTDRHGIGTAVDPARVKAALGSITLGVSGTCPKCEFTGACAGYPSPGALDVWYISTDGAVGPVGEPHPLSWDLDP